MSIDFDGEDSFWFDDVTTSLDFRPTHHLDGSDGFNTDDFTQGPNPHLVKFIGADSFTLEDNTDGLLRNDTFHGSDSFSLSDAATSNFPRYFRGTSTVTFTDVGTKHLSIRNFNGADSLGFFEVAGFVVAGYQVSTFDSIRFTELFTFEKVLGPNNKTGADSVAFTDSGTLTKGKANKESIIFSDAGCICLVSSRTASDIFSFSERPVLWKNNLRRLPDITLPGGRGAIFKAIIRWNKVEGIKFMDEGYRIGADGNPVPDYSCCNPPVIYPGFAWSSLEFWSPIESFGDMLE
jgi:hypothetical protein